MDKKNEQEYEHYSCPNCGSNLHWVCDNMSSELGWAEEDTPEDRVVGDYECTQCGCEIYIVYPN